MFPLYNVGHTGTEHKRVVRGDDIAFNQSDCRIFDHVTHDPLTSGTPLGKEKAKKDIHVCFGCTWFGTKNIHK